MHARGEPFDSPLILSLSKDERLAQDRLVEPRALGSPLQVLPGLTARGESPAAFDGRCIPAGCVAPPSNIPDILGRRALPAGRLARLGATLDFHHGLLTRLSDDVDQH